MIQEQDPRPAIADQLRFAAKHARQARDFLNTLLHEEGIAMTLDVATVLALTAPLTASLAKLAQQIDPHPARKRSGRRK